MFSVLIPVFNHARFLRQAAESALRDPLVGGGDDVAQASLEPASLGADQVRSEE